MCNHGPFFKTDKNYFSKFTIDKFTPDSIALNPITDIQTQTDEKPRTPKKSRNSLGEPIVEEIENKSLSTMPDQENHLLFGKKIHTLSRSSLPSKLQTINFIRFKIDSTTKKQYSRKEKIVKYREVAKELVSIWSEVYIVCFDSDYVIDRIQKKIIPLLEAVQKNNKVYTNEERKKAKLSELNKIFDIAKCPCFR